MAAAVSKVLDDDDLLIEILLRLAFPTTLVRAVLVSKRWYHHASDRKFLRRFRKHHPPSLLGFYTADERWPQPTGPRFVPMQLEPPELGAVVRRVASYNFRTHDNVFIMDCQNGNVFTGRRDGSGLTYGMDHPLCTERCTYIFPPLPSAQDPSQHMLDAILSKEGECGLSYLYLLATWTNETKKFTVRVYMLQGSFWRMHTSATDQIDYLLFRPKVVLAGNKIYMAIDFSHDIFILDLIASSFSRIQLPQGVKYDSLNTTLSRAEDASSVHLIHVDDELQLCIWLHKGNNWLLVDTICLPQLWANLRMLDHTLEDEHICFSSIRQVGDNAEFAFLKMCGSTFYLDITRRTLRNVHGILVKDQYFNAAIYPFMMIWPPIFPTLKAGPARNAM